MYNHLLSNKTCLYVPPKKVISNHTFSLNPYPNSKPNPISHPYVLPTYIVFLPEKKKKKKKKERK